jgi:hypothetical protein
MKTKLISFLAMVLMSTSVFAQKADTTKKSHLTHSFGFNAGTTTGVGLSYQMYVKNKYGLQFTASPYILSVDNQRLNFGLTGLYKIRDREYVDFISYLSLNYIYTRQPGYSYVNYTYQDVVSNISQVNIGTGIGFEFDTKRNFKFSIMGGFAGYSTNNIWQVLPCIESSLFYVL